MPQNTRSNSQLLRCSIGKLDAPEAFQIGHESPDPIKQETNAATERKTSTTIRKLTMRPFQPKPSFDDLPKEQQSVAPTAPRFPRSNSQLLRCSIGKLDAPEAFQIGHEAPDPNKRKPSATIRKLTMRPFQPKPSLDELLKEDQNSDSEPQYIRS